MRPHLFAIAGTAVLSMLLSGEGLACSPPAPTLDANGRPIYPPPPELRYRFLATVLGEEQVTIAKTNRMSGYVVKALRVRVLESAHAEVVAGEERTLYGAGIGADCGFSATSLYIDQFPPGTTLQIDSNDLVSARVERANK